MLRLTLLLLVAALTASAQTAVPIPFGECGFRDLDNGAIAPKVAIGEPNEFAIPQGDLCEMYTFEAGWEETMKLKLGEGAEDYLPLIEQAVKVWNETVRLPSREPLIKISNSRPTNYRLSRSFWDDPDAEADENLDDEENVIYFNPSSDEDSYRGTTWVQWYKSSRRMADADIYINTSAEEEFGPDLARTKLIIDYPGLFAGDDEYGEDWGWGAYAMVNATYIVILHELGHAVGLKHIPVNGNVMSRDFMPGVDEQWVATLAAFWRFRERNDALRGEYGHRPLPLFNRTHDSMFPYLIFAEGQRETVDLFTATARLGAQEKMALACIYEY